MRLCWARSVRALLLPLQAALPWLWLLAVWTAVLCP